MLHSRISCLNWPFTAVLLLPNSTDLFPCQVPFHYSLILFLHNSQGLRATAQRATFFFLQENF